MAEGRNVGIYVPADVWERWVRATEDLPRRKAPSLSGICQEAIASWLNSNACTAHGRAACPLCVI